MPFEIVVNGSGTSTGVPLLGCSCQVCLSDDPQNHRLRASLMVRRKKSQSYNSAQDVTILIDTGPDVRQQLLRQKVSHLNAVLMTHYHYDHAGGLEDLRPFAFLQSEAFPFFCDGKTLAAVKRRSGYLFEHENSRRRKNINLEIHEIVAEQDSPLQEFHLENFLIEPVELLHEPFSGMRSIGYVFDKKFAYLTDFKEIFEYEKHKLYNLQAMYLGAPLNKEHPTHISMQQAFAIIDEFKPQRGIIGHLSHQYSHQQLKDFFPSNCEPAYDGMVIEID